MTSLIAEGANSAFLVEVAGSEIHRRNLRDHDTATDITML